MSDDARDHTRSARAVSVLVEAIEIPVAAGPPLSRRRRRSPAIAAGIAAALLLVATVVGVQVSPRLVQQPATAAATLPGTLPGNTLLRLSQQVSPLPAVGMTWTFSGDGDIPPLDSPHDVLLAADLRATRHADDEDTSTEVVSPSGTMLATGTKDGGIRIEDLASGSVTTIDAPSGTPDMWSTQIRTWSPDSRAVYVDTEDHSGAALWKVFLDGHAVRVPTTTYPYQVAPAPDGRHVALVRKGQRVDILDETTGAVTERLPLERVPAGRTDVGTQVVWSPDESRLVMIAEHTPGEASPWGRPSTVVTVVDRRSGSRRAVTWDGFSCDPLTMLTADRVLCLSTGTTTPGVPVLEAPQGLVTFDLSTGARTVVAAGSAGSLMTQVSVADDLARRWAFERSDPWVEPAYQP